MCIRDRVYPAYRKAVSWSIHHKLVVLGVSLLLLVGSAGACKQQGRLEGFYRMWQSPDPAARWQPILTPRCV